MELPLIRSDFRHATLYQGESTNWYRWQPKYLALQSPGLNPIERIRLIRKVGWFNHPICKNEKILERLDQAIFALLIIQKRPITQWNRNVILPNALIGYDMQK